MQLTGEVHSQFLRFSYHLAGLLDILGILLLGGQTLKKKIIVITTVALMFGGSIGFAAANSSLIGAKVQGLFTVQKQDGTKIGDAVIINGSAYAPVRAISEVTGTELIVEGKKIIMGESTNVTDPLIALTDTRKSVTEEIEAHEKQINGYKENILPTYKTLADELAGNGSLGQRAADDYAAFKKQVDTWETELATLKQQLSDVDAKIAELEK